GSPSVIEFNCRFGDPETQPIMMRLESDLVELCLAALDGDLAETKANWDSRTAVGVVMAAGGYPGEYEKGKLISGLPEATPAVKVFHAGTRLENGKLTTNGGRVLCVTALGDTAGQAQQAAYKCVDKINWEGAFCRTDIGYRAILREREQRPQN
ncbi:MAG TPA: phosphoribosylamine--glycine ligase, partial [Porticoccaceae bacterium]|nr:phosphoribosylamine--glycine ligase [Porticoccaceae bacterium]